MNRKISFVLFFFVLVSNFTFAQIKPEKELSRGMPFIVAYLAEWRLANYPIKEIETRGAAKRLTHIIYAFANVADGLPLIADEQAAYRRIYSARESVDGKADSVSGANLIARCI